MSATGLVCSVTAGLAVAYGVEEWRRLRSGRLMHLVSPAQARLRILGSLLVAVLMVLVFFGLELIDPHQTGRRFAAVWIAASVLTFLLLVLAALDIRALRRNGARERQRALAASLRERGDVAGPD
jgi:hypothetical protein